ncbi:MAG: hypothetical protein IT287_03565, partial [Bdellovibrionaceae bacterium]|nr:hypothetical protein [Pseudobdellovibrionaceae bacterium]
MSDQRTALRHNIDPLEIHGMISIASLTPICDFGYITDASSTGFKLIVKRTDLCDAALK